MTPWCAPNSKELRDNIEIVITVISQDWRAIRLESEMLRKGMEGDLLCWPCMLCSCLAVAST